MVMQQAKLLIFCFLGTTFFIDAMQDKLANKGKVDKFALLAQKAEERYQRSNNTQQQVITQPEVPKISVQEVVEPKKQLAIQDSEMIKGNPKIIKHKEFSEEWWEKLFNPCVGCEDRKRPLNCKELLNNNKQWQDVQTMSAQGKQIVMKRTMQRFYRHILSENVCTMACAVCAGGDPNERLDGEDPHTALHVAAGAGLNRNFQLFTLLLEKGANPNLKCMPIHPLRFRDRNKWKNALISAGAKEDLQQKDHLIAQNMDNQVMNGQPLM